MVVKSGLVYRPFLAFSPAQQPLPQMQLLPHLLYQFLSAACTSALRRGGMQS